jgi:hypothetical protein
MMTFTQPQEAPMEPQRDPRVVLEAVADGLMVLQRAPPAPQSPTDILRQKITTEGGKFQRETVSKATQRWAGGSATTPGKKAPKAPNPAKKAARAAKPPKKAAKAAKKAASPKKPASPH